MRGSGKQRGERGTGFGARLAGVLVLVPGLTGATVYTTLAEWETAIGEPYRIEEFDGPHQSIPQFSDGDAMELPHFRIEANSGEHSVSVGGGTFSGDTHWDYLSPRDSFEPDENGWWEYQEQKPTYNRFVFPVPIRAFFVEVSYSENPELSVWTEHGGVFLYRDDRTGPYDDSLHPRGVILDAPASVVDFASGFSWYSVDSFRWVPAPEPGTASLLAAGLWWLAASRRAPSRRSQGARERPCEGVAALWKQPRGKL